MESVGLPALKSAAKCKGKKVTASLDGPSESDWGDGRRNKGHGRCKELQAFLSWLESPEKCEKAFVSRAEQWWLLFLEQASFQNIGHCREMPSSKYASAYCRRQQWKLLANPVTRHISLVKGSTACGALPTKVGITFSCRALCFGFDSVAVFVMECRRMKLLGCVRFWFALNGV